MRLSGLQNEGMPFKSLVIISTNGVHVFLYYNGEHIGVCVVSRKTLNERKRLRDFGLLEQRMLNQFHLYFCFVLQQVIIS